ncbi:MAG: phosphatase PAP2 family protein [Vicinamibacterales bacterium]
MNFLRLATVLVAALVFAVPAHAQEAAPADATRPEAQAAETTPGAGSEAAPQLPRPGLPLPTGIVPGIESGSGNLFKLVGNDFKNFFSSDTARVLGIVSVGAVIAAPWDREGVNNGFNIPTTLFESGNIMGQVLFQVGAGFATNAVGRATANDKLKRVGRDMVRAQLLSQALVQTVKATVRRERPDGSNKGAFPSGHSASAFATAGVLHRHYGWKVGVPAYAFGSYVALARMAWNRHHATDVVMGMGVGLASARTVTMGLGGAKFNVGVQPQAGGASVNFTKIYK